MSNLAILVHQGSGVIALLILMVWDIRPNTGTKAGNVAFFWIRWAILASIIYYVSNVIIETTEEVVSEA